MVADERVRRRFARRQWRRRWHVWRTALAALTILTLTLFGVWAVNFSDLLSADTVEVSGEKLLTADQVIAAARVQLGEPLARIDVSAIDRRVESLAQVSKAEVTKVWPDRIAIEVLEREAVATVEVGGVVRGMDATGVLFRDYAKAPRGLPRIRSDKKVDTDTLSEAGKVVSALPATLARAVDYVSVETIDQISLVLKDGRTVLWGSADESGDKALVLTKLLKTPARSYDVSVPGLPTFRT